MPFNGSGVFIPPGASFPAVPNTLIESSKFNNVINDIASALSTCITKDGQTVVLANIPFGNHRLTGVANGTSPGDAANVSQLTDLSAALAADTGATLIGVADGRTLQENIDAPAFSDIAKGTKLGAIFTEYWNTTPGNGTAKSAFGALGNPEANMSFNMDYTTGVHKYYDSTFNALWWTLNSDAFALQVAPFGQDPSVDIWFNSGSKYAFGGNPVYCTFFINGYLGYDVGTAQLAIRRNTDEPSIGGDVDLVIEGSRIKGDAAPVLINAYNTGDVILASGGGNTGIGLTTPLNKLEVATATADGSASVDGACFSDGGGATRVGLNVGVNTGSAYAWLQASKGGTGFKDIVLQPQAGTLTIGMVGSPLAYAAHPSAKLAVDSTTQGMLPPRMTTTQKNAISSPEEGLMVYDITLHRPCFYSGSAWVTM